MRGYRRFSDRARRRAAIALLVSLPLVGGCGTVQETAPAEVALGADTGGRGTATTTDGGSNGFEAPPKALPRTVQTTTTTTLKISAPSTAQTPGSAQPTSTTAGTSSTSTTAATTTTEIQPLQVGMVEDPFICDGNRRAVATVAGALSGESIRFTTPSFGDLLPGSADGNGAVTVNWRCDGGSAAGAVTVIAVGATSGRTATFTVTEMAPAPTSTLPPPTTAAPTSLNVALTENPFVCSGERRPFGRVTGANPGETIAFSESSIGPLQSGTADGSGAVTVHWRCDRANAGQTWTITATGLSSGRSVSFSVTGA